MRSLPGLDLRPTSDRLRETLFDVLGAAGNLEDSVWLDLYAGTGAVGIEALSRGARQVYFVESAKKHARLLRDNLESLAVTDGFELHERDVAQALPLLGEHRRGLRLLLPRSAVSHARQLRAHPGLPVAIAPATAGEHRSSLSMKRSSIPANASARWCAIGDWIRAMLR